MNKIPFKTIGICSAVLTVLILLRCLVSIGRVLYYGGTYWLSVIQEDPWLYVSVISAAVCVACFLIAYRQDHIWEEPVDEDDGDEDDLDEE